MRVFKQSYTLALAGAVLVLAVVSCTKSSNWRQFRGPDGNIVLTSANLPVKWGTDTNIVWKAVLDGTGYSSPVIWGNKVIITSAFPEKANPVPERPMGPPPQSAPQPGQGAPAPQPGRPMPPQGQPPVQGPPQPEIRDTSFKTEIYRWELKCYDLKTGAELWKKVAYQGAPKTGKNPNSTYACETPVTDGKFIYALMGMHGLYCYDTDGNLIWKKDPGAYYTQRNWGTGSSPVLHNGILYIQYDNEDSSFIIAIEASTGNEKWRIQRDEKTTYSTPYIWKNQIRTELVACGKKARSYDPVTGKLLWELPLGGEQVIPSPIGTGDLLFLGNPGGRETKSRFFAVRAGFDGDISNTGVAWMTEESGLGNASPLLFRGLLYIIGSRGEINVLDAATGSVKYQKRIAGIGAVWATPWAANDIIYFIDERGTTRGFKAGETFELVIENKLEGSKFWSTVAVSGNKILFKGAEALYCIGK